MWLGIGIGVLLALLPVWRGAGHSRFDGVNLPKLLADSSRSIKKSPFGHPHLPYEEAVRRARQAYVKKNTSSRSDSLLYHSYL